MSKIDPIFVYNQHKSPVSALGFGRYSQQPVLVSGSNDGELHVWRLTDFASLIKIEAHQSKVLGVECLDGGLVEGQTENGRSDKKMNENLTDYPTAGQEQSSKSRSVNENGGLRFVSQEKNGLIKFALAIGNRLLLACVSTGSSNCVNLVAMNEERADRDADHNANQNRTDAPDGGNQNNCGVLLNERIVQIDQALGMISSMRMKAYDGLILLLIGTEMGSCLIYTGSWDASWNEDLDERRKVGTSSGAKAENRFTLKYRQQCFGETFVSSVELDDGRLLSGGHLRLICGSIEDCLAVVDLIVEFADRRPGQDSQALRPADDELPNQMKIRKPQASFRNKETAKPVKYLKITNKGINSIACRPDSRLFASGGSDGRVRLFSLKSLNALAVLAFHKQTIEMIKFSAYLTEHKGHLLAAAGADRLVTVWSVYNG